MRLTVRNKLFAGFGIVAALMIALGVVAVSKLATVYQSTKEFNESVVPGIESMGSIDAAVQSYRRNQWAHTAATDTTEMEKDEEEMAAEQATIDETLVAYEKIILDAEDRKKFDDFTAKWTAYLEASDAFLAHSRAGRAVQARAVLNETGEAFGAVSETIATST